MPNQLNFNLIVTVNHFKINLFPRYSINIEGNNAREMAFEKLRVRLLEVTFDDTYLEEFLSDTAIVPTVFT